MLVDVTTHAIIPSSQWPPAVSRVKFQKFAAFTDSFYRKTDPTNRVVQFYPKPQMVRYQGFQIQLSGSTYIRDVDISPQNDCAAWLLTTVQHNPVAVEVHRIYPKITAPPKYITALWITRKGDPQPHEIGWIERLAKPNAFDEFFCEIQWSPDAKSVAFLYRHTLYTILIP